MEITEVLKWLRKKEFDVENSHVFYPEYIFCKRNQINLVLKEYCEKDSEKIRYDSSEIRSTVNQIGENVWNTYFLICRSSGTEPLPYSIERDSVGVRKYVINSEKDFLRIPFLDEMNNEKNASNTELLNIHSSQNESLENLTNYLIDIEGSHRVLNKKEISELLTKVYKLDVEEYEN
ncbi:hypothetical protein LCM14_06165 [Priestia aryabhattai]|jgi:hypothetical protein|uniref:ABC-three component system middle component 1 n=2 Tax=Priestia TaxID=2800373 RepID=UPI001CD3B578|nr:ABC-three component system middle component 1 [Priestia aryabhattai]MCA1049376.1 hypothetical protein [Priestia aryabhattai]